MSFASKIKESLCRTQADRPCCRAAELTALVCFAGTYAQGRLKIKTEHESVAQRVVTLLSDLLGEGGCAYTRPKRESGWHTVTVSGYAAESLFDALSLYQNGVVTLCPADVTRLSACCRTAFLRGAFLGGGSMSDPEKNYHLEFVTKTAPLADRLYELLEALSFPAKITVRKNSFVVYIKESEAIAQLLGLIGAGGSMMEFYNIKIERELRNTVNRQVNCDSANLDKITAAAGRQIAAIEKIRRTIGFDSLPPVLSEMAALRLENPEMSLSELGALLDPPIGKSGVNHRLERICEIAGSL